MRRKSSFSIHLSLGLAVSCVFCAPGRAQENQAATRTAAEVPAASDPKKPSKIEGAVKGEGKSPDPVEELKTKIEKLTALVERQQAALAEMQKRLDGMETKERAAAPAALVTPPPVEAANAKAALDSKAAAAPTPAQNQAKSQDKPVLLAGWDRNRAVLRSADGDFETAITGYAQLDFRGYQSGALGARPPNTFLVRRARLVLEGKVQRYFDFKIEGDFADTAGTLLRDVYGRIHRLDELQFTFGQFRVPYSQEEMRSDAFQDFVERSLVNNLAPSRSPGVMFSGVINKGVFEYQVGAFNGRGLLALNTTGTPESALRLRFALWKNGGDFWTKGLIFGGAYSQGRNVGLSVRGQTESRSTIFFAPDTVSGKLIRTNGEFTWLLGPAAIRAEYDQTNQERETLGPGGTNLPGVVAKGYMGQFTYLLTGETKPEAGAVVPRRNLFGDGNGNAGFGAWELKFRYSNLQISDATVKSNRAETFYFGPNWYLNRYVRYLLDFGVERFKDPLRAPNPGDRNFFVVLSRIQVAF